MNIQEIKKEFFTYRNGMIADTLRKAGMNYKVIYGLNFPQLSGIAQMVVANREIIAKELWNDQEVRESRLLACHLFNPETLTERDALEMMKSVKTREEADILSFRLLRRLPYSKDLLLKYESAASDSLQQYLCKALKRNILPEKE